MKKLFANIFIIFVFSQSLNAQPEPSDWKTVQIKLNELLHPSLLPDARPEYKAKIEAHLKECGIDPKKVVIKEKKLENCSAFVRKEFFGNKYYFVIDPEQNPINEGETLLTIFHEIGHISNDHGFMLTPLITAPASYLTMNSLFNKIINTSLEPKNKNTLVQRAITNTPSIYCAYLTGKYLFRTISKFQEMEADLYALNKLTDPDKPKAYRISAAKYVLSSNKNGTYDDGLHPTDKEQYEYYSKFVIDKYAEKNPSIKKYCWNYILNEHTPKPIGKIYNYLQKHD